MVNLSDLNSEQRIAAQTLEGPVLIIAGAGSGKTKMLTYRIANLIDHGVPPWSIMALTFTNKAATEMKERIVKLVDERADDVWISTFHSMCAKILRKDIDKLEYKNTFVIYDDADQIVLIKEIIKKFNLDEKKYSSQIIKGTIAHAKECLLSPKEWFQKSEGGYRNQIIMDIYAEYETRMKNNNALDFNDLIIKTIELFVLHPPVLDYYQKKIQYIHIDEYQDTDQSQYQLIRLISGQKKNLCVVGDDDQSIYGWRGADIRNILEFEKDFPETKVIKLEQNYRSTSNILDAANQIISENENRREKKLWTKRSEGEKISLYSAKNEWDEANWVLNCIKDLLIGGESLSSIAILYRTNAQSRIIEEILIKNGIRYKIYGGLGFYDRKEIKDILAYLKILSNPNDDISLKRIINFPKRGIGETTIQQLVTISEEEKIPLMSICLDTPSSIGNRAYKSIQNFSDLIMDFMIKKDNLQISQLADYIVHKTEMIEKYKADNSEENQSRIENIKEFLGAISEFEEKNPNASIQDFLETTALISNFDEIDTNLSSVTLMTVHGSKGLEFKNVFLIGMEENVFPTYRSLDEGGNIEEERRLCYVAVTRAKDRLYLSHAKTRRLYNYEQFNEISRFIRAIPNRLISEITNEWIDASSYSNFSIFDKQSSGRRQFLETSDNEELILKDKKNEVSAIIGKATVYGVQKGFGKPINDFNSNKQSFTHYYPNCRVIHQTYGMGRVLQVSGSGMKQKIYVHFINGIDMEVLASSTSIRSIEKDDLNG